MRPSFDHENLMAFARPKIGGKEIQIATAFHKYPDPSKDAQKNGELRFINNLVVQFGVTFFLPPDFKYTTFK